MTLKKKQNIDQLLNSYFREEARRLEVPDGHRCWEDFQQLLEKRGQDELCLDDTIPAVEPPQKGTVYQFMRKYRNLTALAAACVLGIMLISGMPPAQSLREALSGMLPGTGKIAGTKMAGTADQKATEQMLELQTIQEEADITGSMPEAAQGPASFQIMQAPEPAAAPPLAEEKEDVSLRQQMAPPGAGEMNVLLQPGSVAEETIELNYNSLNAYRSGLQENRRLARGKIIYLAVPPEGYTFREAVIFKTESVLYSVRQEFSNRSGDVLILQQNFFEPAILPAAEPDVEGEALPPVLDEVESFTTDWQKTYHGYGEQRYELFPLNGQNMMQIKLDGSVIMITAELDEGELLVVSDKLEVVENR